jgi:hypothetical protein
MSKPNYLSVKGIEGVSNIIKTIVGGGYSVHVWTDDFQFDNYKPEDRNFTIEIADTRNGQRFILDDENEWDVEEIEPTHTLEDVVDEVLGKEDYQVSWKTTYPYLDIDEYSKDDWEDILGSKGYAVDSAQTYALLITDKKFNDDYIEVYISLYGGEISFNIGRHNEYLKIKPFIEELENEGLVVWR